MLLEFTPLEFETYTITGEFSSDNKIRIYSVGVWNRSSMPFLQKGQVLEFTPLEFETKYQIEFFEHS